MARATKRDQVFQFVRVLIRTERINGFIMMNLKMLGSATLAAAMAIPFQG
jgi:hypothetical protein